MPGSKGCGVGLGSDYDFTGNVTKIVDGDMSMNAAQKALAKMAYQVAGLTPGKWHRGFSAS